MNNIIINTSDRKTTIEYKVANLFSKNSRSKLTKNQLHTPVAAKLIIESSDKIFMFLLINPIIQVDGSGIINVFTTLTYDQISLKKDILPVDFDIREAKVMAKIFNAKSKIGLTLEEVYLKSVNEQNIEISNMIKNKVSFEIGGGF